MSRGAGTPERDAVRLDVRYRPSADVLMGQVAHRTTDVAGEAVQRDTPDADTTLEWVRRPDGVRHLVGFQVLFAAARAAEGRLSPSLPDGLDAQLVPVVRSLASPGRAPDPLLRSEVELEVPAADLELPSDLLGDLERRSEASVGRHFMVTLSSATPHTTGRASPDAVGAALDELAAVIDAVPEADEVPTGRLVGTLDSLGETIATSGGLTAPGCSAAARVALRGGTPLTAGERRTLAHLLHQLDDHDQWASAIAGLRQLTTRLQGKGRA